MSQRLCNLSIDTNAAQPIIRFFYNRSKALFNILSSPQGRQSRSRKRSVVTSIAHSSDFVDLCALYGYYAEEHVVQTGDGYLLGLHRLGWKRGEEDLRVNAGEGSIRKKVVYLHHGLMMNSEIWVCLTERERCLPFMLVEKGYDVWVRNSNPLFTREQCLKYVVREQSWQQIFEEIDSVLAKFLRFLELFHRSICLS